MNLRPKATVIIMKPKKDPYQPQVLYHDGVPCGQWCSAPYINNNGNSNGFLSSRMWVAKPGRPIAEPPIFDYEAFVDENIPSDIRMEKLFPKDIDARTKFRDALTEMYLLMRYRGWNHDMWKDFKGEGDVERQTLHEGLRKVVHVDFIAVKAEWDTVDPRSCPGYSVAGHWEYLHLDQDGGMKGIERDLEAYRDIFSEMPEEDATKVISKYGHLAPADYFSTLPQRRLAAWESRWLDGNEKHQRTFEGLHDKILDGTDVFYEHNNQDLTLNWDKLPLMMRTGNLQKKRRRNMDTLRWFRDMGGVRGYTVRMHFSTHFSAIVWRRIMYHPALHILERPRHHQPRKGLSPMA